MCWDFDTVCIVFGAGCDDRFITYYKIHVFFKYLIIFQTDAYDVKIEISSCDKILKKNNYDIKIFLRLKIPRRRNYVAFVNYVNFF